jgi:hypothetical protein
VPSQQRSRPKIMMDEACKGFVSMDGVYMYAAHARSQCRFALVPIYFTRDSLRESVPLFLARQCDRTLGIVLVQGLSFPT